MNILPLILPDFLLIALGWLLLRHGVLTREFFIGAEKLVYFTLFPALLFHSLTQAPLALSTSYLLVLAALSLMAVGIALAWLAVPLLRPDPVVHASVAQCIYRFNTFIGLSMAGGIAGPTGQSLMAIIVGFSVPLANLAAVHALARHQGRNLLKESLRNPLIVATLLGLAFNLLDITIPAPVATTLGRLGACAIAIGLICVGASLTLSLDQRKGTYPLGIWTIVARLLAMPLLALLIGRLLHLPPAEQQMLLLFGTLPTASSAYVLAVRMGGDGRLVALVTTLTTLLSAVTIPFWLYIETLL